MRDGPAFYARTGSVVADLLAILHPPYTAWHLSYVVIGASLAATVSLSLLAWTLFVFFLAVGIGAHALDEVNARPLKTGLSGGALWGMAIAALGAAAVVVVLGSVVLSPWIWAWAVVGLFFAVGYPLEWPALLHTNLGFAVAWGAYPVLAGYWVQTESVSFGAAIVAGFATLLSLAQRSLSTPARFVRRETATASAQFDADAWDRARVLASWEIPLRWLALAVVALAVGLLVAKL
ncbi:MAG: hypothetical protein BMS9Abin07_2257 [Acidimicrobiia bacterium]|nr:MAG: hypothetical protein BMS9Abin07_2257 [Acidimicrobiia bacterium]